MKRATADKIRAKLTEFRSELFINEWNDIIDSIYKWVENDTLGKPEQKRIEEPPLKALAKVSFNTPLWLHATIFVAGLFFGWFI